MPLISALVDSSIQFNQLISTNKTQYQQNVKKRKHQRFASTLKRLERNCPAVPSSRFPTTQPEYYPHTVDINAVPGTLVPRLSKYTIYSPKPLSRPSRVHDGSDIAGYEASRALLPCTLAHSSPLVRLSSLKLITLRGTGGCGTPDISMCSMAHASTGQ